MLWDLLHGASPRATEAIGDLVMSRAVKDPDSERVLVRQGLLIAERFTLFASPCPGGLVLMLRPDGEPSDFSSFSVEHFRLEEDGRHAEHRQGEGRIRVALAEREQANSLVEELHFLTDVDLRERKLSAPPDGWRHRLRIKAGSWIEWPAEAFAPSLRFPQAQ